MNAMNVEETRSLERDYRVLFELGRGGMARVYLAESLLSGLRKLVVLKVLNGELCANPHLRAAFRREAELSAHMNHPNIVQVLQVVEHAQTPVIVMEHLDGVALSHLLRHVRDKLPLPLHLSIFSQVLAGLHHFHELRDLDGASLNGVHRDVSPQNIFVLHDGPVKVLDFGIAKVSQTDEQVTRAGVVKGKLHYMPPEQFLGEAEVDRRADIFAVGVMLWEAVARRRMWQGKSESEVLRSLAMAVIPTLRDAAPEAPEALLEIVESATSVDRERRFPTAHAMQGAIDRAMVEQGWFVGARDLADFMHVHFGEARRAQELQIKSARRAPMTPDALLECTPAAPLAGETRGLGISAPQSKSPELLVSRVWTTTSRAKWGWAAAISCSSLALAGALWGRGPSAAPQPVLTARIAAAQTVNLDVDVVPRAAAISLDGKPLGTGHFSGRLPAVDHKVALVFDAPGYLSERRELAPRKDVALEVVLQPETTLEAQAPSASEATPSSSAVENRLSNSRALHPQASAVARKTKAPAGCDPPYVFGPDGVKTYKRECF
jgi:hypothetical protein